MYGFLIITTTAAKGIFFRRPVNVSHLHTAMNHFSWAGEKEFSCHRRPAGLTNTSQALSRTYFGISLGL